MSADPNAGAPVQDPRTAAMATAAAAAAAAPANAGGVPYPTAFFGHPRGLATLFFTEFWERFSYYGMRALLILFMTSETVTGGLGFSTPRAGAIYGLYTGAVYLMALPGGWMADRLLGQRRAVFLGGCLIAAGNFSLAVPSMPTFFAGLALVAMGTGLLKPNVSTMVGELYPDDYARRDAGFSIFYMGINLGAFIAPLICGPLGQRVDWHLGFAAAGAGMALGVLQYSLGGRYLGTAGLRTNAEVDAAGRGRSWKLLAGSCALVALLAALVVAGVVRLTAEHVAAGTTGAILVLALIYFLYQIFAGGLDRGETKRMLAIFVLCVFSTLFWCGYEQAGSSLNLFAEKLTNRKIFSWDMPASVLQSVNPLFVIILAPVFALIWVRLGRRNPSSPAKFAFGLVLLALGFVTMVAASLSSVGRAVVGASLTPRQVSVWWLVLTYLLHSCGELCLSPVGLSTVTKLAPHRKVSQMMGIWFMSLSLGNLIGGQIAGRFEAIPLYQIFGTVALVTGAAGLFLLLLVRPMRALLGGAE
jgi:POT family proton-dependent oligopeptide transporter